MPNKNSAVAAALTLMLSGVAGMAHAVPIDIPLVDVQSVGNLNVAGNTILDINVGASTEITSLGFNVALTAFAPSWISEMSIKVYNTSGTGGVLMRPAVNDYDYQYSGTASFAFVLDLSNLALAFLPDADGLIHLQFYENPVDDLAGADGIWNGQITLNAPVAVVPEPTSHALMVLGLGLVVGRIAARSRCKSAC